MQPPMNPEIIHEGGRGATLRGRRTIAEATTRRPPTIASVDQRGRSMTHVVSAVQARMSVPGQARDSGVDHGRGRGRGKPER
ncbi:short chain dehydrogenase, partial [Actinomyces sp. oral taxon 180 str. F0310]